MGTDSFFSAWRGCSTGRIQFADIAHPEWNSQKCIVRSEYISFSLHQTAVKLHVIYQEKYNRMNNTAHRFVDQFELVWNEYSINTTDLIVKRVPLYFISWWSNDTLWDRECVSECPCVWSTSNELVQCWSAIESKLETMKFIHCTCMRVHGSMQAFYGLQL